MKKNIFKTLQCLFVFLAAVGCGVKGDPLPPATPVEIGRGGPSHKVTGSDFVAPAERQNLKVEPPEPEDSDEE